MPMICASLYRAVFIKNLLRYLAEKILLLNTTNFRGDYPYPGNCPRIGEQLNSFLFTGLKNDHSRQIYMDSTAQLSLISGGLP
jgi:hypothetical protein